MVNTPPPPPLQNAQCLWKYTQSGTIRRGKNNYKYTYVMWPTVFTGTVAMCKKILVKRWLAEGEVLTIGVGEQDVSLAGGERVQLGRVHHLGQQIID